MNKKFLLLYVFIVIIFFAVGIYINANSHTKFALLFPKKITETAEIRKNKETAQVKRIIDGDTIVLSDDRKVRYIGIDAPEVHHPQKSVQCYGTEAAQFNKTLVEGKQITFQKDISDTDRYGRLLRYVWVGDIFVNDYLLKEGYARQSTFPPDVAYAELFRASAETAQIQNKGLWNKCRE